MRLNVNGAKIWSRGANLIPMDEMDGRLTESAYHYMLKSAKDSNYNTLRVWGGGLYYHDIVYDTADEMGLLMYHDAMYGQPWFGGNSGVAIDNRMQDAELRYQLRRLSAHPCVFIWDACNECGGKGTCKSTG
jgi:beta-mannosidase